MQHRVTTALFLAWVIFVVTPHESLAGAVDLGVGLGFADSSNSDGFEGGWDIQAGYSTPVSDNWGMGGQLHLIHGWTGKEENRSDAYDTRMYFQSSALYVTLHPLHQGFHWLDLKAGVVSVDAITSSWAASGIGTAVGAGIVIGDARLRLHLLDIYRYQLGGHSFNIYAISLAVLAH